MNKSEGQTLPTVGGPPSRLSVAQVSLIITFLMIGAWYLEWRLGTFNPHALWFSWLVYGAEVFGFFGALCYIFTCWRLEDRQALPVPEGRTADVFIPTINEPVYMLRRTLVAAKRMKHVGQVWLLDDGNRPEMRQLAEEIGCRYLAREQNIHAKAGNLNNALKHCDAEYIAVFDCDHAPSVGFLDETLGFFNDQRVAFVQTPQDFYNLDSFQHRVDRDHSLVWSEQMLFFRVIQAGKDRLNAAFFCGSCAVVRRSAIEDVGGFATGTVTEDIHTSLLLHKRGWKSVYYGRSLAFGMAPAGAIPFLKQRLRWGQGAMQVWRREGIVFGRGLSFGQRISYLATLMQYFEGWQRGILFLAPVVVLGLGVMPIVAFDRDFIVHFLPYIILNYWVYEEVARGYGRSLLTEQYTMMRFAIFVTATFGFFFRKLRFVVTSKMLGEADATRRTLWPQHLVLILNSVAIPVGVFYHWRLGHLSTGAVVANIIWAGFALGVAALAIGYAIRLARHRRREYRFPLPVPFKLAREPRSVMVRASDISSLGCRLTGPVAVTAVVGDRLAGQLLLPAGPLKVDAIVRSRLVEKLRNGEERISVGCEFDWKHFAERMQLDAFLFGSDLQMRLNGWREQTPTPWDRVSAVLKGAWRGAKLPRAEGWSPLVFRDANAESGIGVGYISRNIMPNGSRALVTVFGMPGGARVAAHEVTENGAQFVDGEVGEPELMGSKLSPLYLHRLHAQ